MLIIGWELDTEMCREYRKEMISRECCSPGGYMCICDTFVVPTPQQFQMVVVYPFKECGHKNTRIYLTYNLEDSSVTFETLQEIMNDTRLFSNAKGFARRLGAKTEPKVMSVCSII